MKNKRTSTLIFAFFVALIFSFQSCAAGNKNLNKGEHEWTVVKSDKGDKPSWTIYRRKVAGSDFLEYKIEGVVKASPRECISWFKEDIRNLANGAERKKYPTYEIVEESDDSLLTYVVHNEPWPLKDTEMSIRYTFFENEDGTAGVQWREAWDESQVPPSKKLSRVETFRGSWSFSPERDDAFKALNSVQFNPKKIPRWFFQPMVAGFLKKGLKRMRNITLS